MPGADLLDSSLGTLQRPGLGHDRRERCSDGEHGVLFFRGCQRGFRQFRDRHRLHDR